LGKKAIDIEMCDHARPVAAADAPAFDEEEGGEQQTFERSAKASGHVALFRTNRKRLMSFSKN
jgi:hypothetical protein